MFLIDTDVLSALRKRKRHPVIAQWVKKQRSADRELHRMCALRDLSSVDHRGKQGGNIGSTLLGPGSAQRPVTELASLCRVAP